MASSSKSRPLESPVLAYFEIVGEKKVRCKLVASSPGHSQILSRSSGEKSGEGLVPLLRHGAEMVDSILT